MHSGTTVFKYSKSRIYDVSSADGEENEDPSSGEDEEGASIMDFPVMPYMQEVDGNAALGISAGCAYKLVYGEDSSGDRCSKINAIGDIPPDDNSNIEAFCKAGWQFFLAANGKAYRFECVSEDDTFDFDGIGDIRHTASCDVNGVERLVYSGTDTTFDMRIYA